jgi:hypothetical protein
MYILARFRILTQIRDASKYITPNGVEKSGSCLNFFLLSEELARERFNTINDYLIIIGPVGSISLCSLLIRLIIEIPRRWIKIMLFLPVCGKTKSCVIFCCMTRNIYEEFCSFLQKQIIHENVPYMNIIL